MDAALMHWIYGDGSGGALWIALSVIGSGWSMLGLVPAVAMRRTRAFAWPLLAALAVNGIVVFLLKMIVGRTRPCNALEGIHSVYFAAPTDASFPSGHAAGSFCFAAFCAVRVWQSQLPRRARIAIVIALFLVASGIALSRVYLGVHYPLDVAAGAILGSVIGSVFGLRVGLRSIQTAPAG